MSDRSYYPIVVSKIQGHITLKIQVEFTTTVGDVADLYDAAMDEFWNGDYEVAHSELTHFEVVDSWDDFDEVG